MGKYQSRHIGTKSSCGYKIWKKSDGKCYTNFNGISLSNVHFSRLDTRVLKSIKFKNKMTYNNIWVCSLLRRRPLKLSPQVACCSSYFILPPLATLVICVYTLNISQKLSDRYNTYCYFPTCCPRTNPH